MTHNLWGVSFGIGRGRTTARGSLPRITSASFHAVVHVDEGIGIERARGRLDAVVEALGLGKIISFYGSKQPSLQTAITLPEPDNKPLQPSTSNEKSEALCVVSTFTGRGSAACGCAIRDGGRCRSSPGWRGWSVLPDTASAACPSDSPCPRCLGRGRKVRSLTARKDVSGQLVDQILIAVSSCERSRSSLWLTFSGRPTG